MNEETEAGSPPPKKQKIEDVNINPEADVPDDVDDVVEGTISNSDTNYSDFMSSADLLKLREFKVLDEVKANEEDSNLEDSDGSDDKSDGLPEEEIEKMLEEDLPEDFKAGPKPKEKPFVTHTKIVLEEKGVNQFEVLPLDWMVVRHHSGMPIYVHKTTRVCTLSKPYFLGKGNIRRHDIPISAVPCLAYRRALEEEEKQKEIDRKVEEEIKNLSKKAATIVNQTTENTLKNSLCKSTNSITDKLLFSFNSNADKNKLSKCPFSQSRNADSEQCQNEDNDKKVSSDSAPIDVMNTLTSDAEVIGNKNKLAVMDFTNDSIIHNEITKEILVDYQGESSFTVSVEDGSVGGANANNDIDKEGAAQVVAEDSDSKDKESDKVSGYEDIPVNRRPVILLNGEILPAPRVESVNNSWKTQNLTPEQFNSYCKSLFQFKSVSILQFNRWADRRKYEKAKKTLQYPTLPEGTKLITIPVQNSGGKGAKRDWVMNVNSGSYLSVFHEYVCRALHKQPSYEYKQLENATTPYQATVYIGGMQYGSGHGSSKRQAKYAAAKSSIHILIPEMREYLDAPSTANGADPDFSRGANDRDWFFDYVTIEDPRIAEFCMATCEPSPHAILRTCLLRNFGASDQHIQTTMKKVARREIELTMNVGKHTATVVCKNKKSGKQRASQAILQALHPHVRSWGSLLRLYGSKSVKSCKEKKLEEQQITLLQDKARHNEPNYAVLEKLRNEMKKLRERDESVVPIGTLLVTDDLPTHSGSNLNNVDL